MAFTVFISSTSKDLESYREIAEKAAVECGFAVSAAKHWSPDGSESVAACLARVREADLVVAILAHRYGWVPSDSNPEFKSITWMECEAAGLEKVLPFLVAEGYSWPAEHYEEHRLTREGKGLRGAALEALHEDVERNEKNLVKFKGWLGSRIRAEFWDQGLFHGQVVKALLEWKAKQSPAAVPVGAPSRKYDNGKYFAELRQETGEIDLDRLRVPREGTRRPEMDALYIPLRTSSSDVGRESVTLESELARHQRLILQGEAGSGKTTFLRRIAWELCEGKPPGETPRKKLELPCTGFPMFIRVSNLDKHIHESVPPAYTNREDPRWLAHFLASQPAAEESGLDEAFFREKLKLANSWLLLDGLDEAADDVRRGHIRALVSKAAKNGDCRYVVSTRPPADGKDAVLPDFARCGVLPLDDGGIEAFLRTWCAWLPRDDAYREELLGDVRRTHRDLRSNPFMLTALAVVYLFNKRLPPQRAELYEEIVEWLGAEAEKRWGQPGYKKHFILNCLQRLALKMQRWEGGRVTVVSKNEAARAIQDQFSGLPEAVRFLERALDASGLLTLRGNQLAFWHKIFLEYLAAREFTYLVGDRTQVALELVYRTEGREMLPLAAVRMKDEFRYLPELFGALIADAQGKPLPELAHAAGVIGSMLRDLKSTGWDLAPVLDEEYRKLLATARAVFHPELQKSIPIQSRVEAAEALGTAGDHRLRTPDEEDYWVPVAGRGKKIRGFDIGRFPVTVFEYARYLDAKDGARKPEDWESQEDFLSRPVVGVTWFDAMAFCAWWAERTRRKTTLPSNWQWVAAARGPEGRDYPWGNQKPTPQRANYWDTGIRRAPTPVGLFPAGNTPGKSRSVTWQGTFGNGREASTMKRNWAMNSRAFAAVLSSTFRATSGRHSVTTIGPAAIGPISGFGVCGNEFPCFFFLFPFSFCSA